MPKKEILEKAIQKAIDGGWDCFGFKHYIVDQTGKFVVFDNFLVDQEETWRETVGITRLTMDIIFNHDFAKALWGDDQMSVDYADLNGADAYYEGSTDGLGREMPAWMHHLQQMVIAEDPIKYLGENT